MIQSPHERAREVVFTQLASHLDGQAAYRLAQEQVKEVTAQARERLLPQHAAVVEDKLKSDLMRMAIGSLGSANFS